MATEILACNKCGSTNMKDVNPQVKDTAHTPVVRVTADCLDCGNRQSYTSATLSGKKRGIRY
jgi:RNase P subunit RPR2